MGKAGLYFHIPFCRSKCPYCDFYSVKYQPSEAENYIDLLCREMKKYDGEFDTVYFGGGTPSILEPTMLVRILDEARRRFTILPGAEITVECNPSKELSRDFSIYAEAGVNRISIGMQSAVNKERFALGRSAGAAEVARTVNDAKKNGINNISVDVMLATPKQTLDSLDETFEFIDEMNVTHISAYMLKLEEGTRFFEMKDRLALPDEDTVCEMYLKTIDSLKALGFTQYEISNFAKPGFESRHNLKYWLLDDYLGIGKTAHSLWQGKRFFYDENMQIINDGYGGGDEEKIMLGLRLNKGVDASLIKADCSSFIKAGLMSESKGRLSLTAKGMLVSNSIISQLM